MTNLKKALLFIAIVSISSSNMYGFWPFFSSKWEKLEDKVSKDYYHVISCPALFPCIRKVTRYGSTTQSKQDTEDSIEKNPETTTVFVKSNIALWTIGLGATGFAAWYKRDAIATGLEKLATLIKKK